MFKFKPENSSEEILLSLKKNLVKQASETKYNLSKVERACQLLKMSIELFEAANMKNEALATSSVLQKVENKLKGKVK